MRKIRPSFYSFRHVVTFEWEKERTAGNEKYWIFLIPARQCTPAVIINIDIKCIKLEELIVQANTIGETKAHELRWLGHLESNSKGKGLDKNQLVPTPWKLICTNFKAMIGDRHPDDRRKWCNLVSDLFESLTQQNSNNIKTT